MVGLFAVALTVCQLASGIIFKATCRTVVPPSSEKNKSKEVMRSVGKELGSN